MEQLKMENVEKNDSGDTEQTICQVKYEYNTPKDEVQTASEDIIIEPLNIKPVVTEVATEIIPMVIHDNGTLDCLNKDCDTSSQASYEVTEELLEVVCIAQSNDSSIDSEIIQEKLVMEDSNNDETVLSEEIEPEETLNVDDVSPSVGTVEDTSHAEEEDANVVEESDTHESCDPGAMSIVEEIVTTTKSVYSIEIQEPDSMDNDEGSESKELTLIVGTTDNEMAISVTAENIAELQIEETHESEVEDEKLSKEALLGEKYNLDVDSHGMDTIIKGESLENVNDDAECSIAVDNVTENETAVENQESLEVEGPNSIKKTENHKSVIQEIVDDWIDDTNEDVCESKNNAIDSHDAVEIELKSLLAEDKPTTKQSSINKESMEHDQAMNTTSGSVKDSPKLRKPQNHMECTSNDHVNGVENKLNDVKTHVTTVENLQDKKQAAIQKHTHTPPQLLDRSVTNAQQDQTSCKRNVQHIRMGVKVSGRHLLSQIASKAEVTEVLQERIKQKQKDIELPQGRDILFVKKITQRLSSKLSAASTNISSGKKTTNKQLNASSENCSNNAADEKMDDAEKIETADNRELLAILEGDVDPDWSNLKPHTVIETTKNSDFPSESNVAGKLDPITERELALKQLLELPTISLKKNAVKKRRTFKPAPNRATSIDEPTLNFEDAKINDTTMDSDMQSLSADEDDPVPMDMVMKLSDPTLEVEETHVEESRSGRKRKPTEKAREHEQNAPKKQKVYKGKITAQKKSPKIQAADTVQEPPDVASEHPKDTTVPVKPKLTDRNILSKIGRTKNRIYQSQSQKMGKKLPQNVVKRNISGKKLLRQKSLANVTNPKTVHMKSKFISSPKKYRSTIKQVVRKNLIDVHSPEIKPKKKSNEIDKLLQDEGVVNLLYDVEQPERKRLVPITKSQTKIMDLHKVQRELKIRTKLVRNAVLRLRTSGVSPTKISPRSKRSMSNINVSESEGREQERSKSTRSSISSSADFVIPAKIRNAADASVIVRRHSSSSFSSTSGSPRVSIDGPDRQLEHGGTEEGPAHVTRSARRRYSQNEKKKQLADIALTQKKNGVNRKKSTETIDGDANEIIQNDTAMQTRPNLRADTKSVEKINKYTDNAENVKSTSQGTANKISTRSNGTTTDKEVIKTKKGTKTKAMTSKAKDVDESEIDVIEAAKLSACLAEAATALSNADGAHNRSGGTTVNRKLRVSPNTTKLTDVPQPDVLDQFSNKEIILRRHGNIVQIILTPSSTKLKNGITLQMMHEICEVLFVLRRDEGCRVVLLTSTGTSFCEGLDLSNVIHDNKEERRLLAEELANGVKEFMKTLANFNKPIVAGVQGAAIGLGVTMLPLFDLVIASDKATFCTPYGQLGQIPEGAANLTLSQTIGNTTTSELLLGGRTLTASEALRAGLVTRVLWPDRFQGELIPSLKAMSEHSSQSMEATKTLLRHGLRKKLDAALETESYLLIQHWCSAECQALIQSYLDGKGH